MDKDEKKEENSNDYSENFKRFQDLLSKLQEKDGPIKNATFGIEAVWSRGYRKMTPQILYLAFKAPVIDNHGMLWYGPNEKASAQLIEEEPDALCIEFENSEDSECDGDCYLFAEPAGKLDPTWIELMYAWKQVNRDLAEIKKNGKLRIRI